MAAACIVLAGCGFGATSDSAATANNTSPAIPLPAPLEETTTTSTTTTTTTKPRPPARSTIIIDDAVPRLTTTTTDATTTTTSAATSTTLPGADDLGGMFAHTDISAAVFVAGNDDGTTAWNPQWSARYGCTVNATNPVLHEPADCVPLLNPFNVALPYNDIGGTGRKPDADLLTAWAGRPVGLWTSLLEGVWVEVTSADGTLVSYGQWVDVLDDGDEAGYVLGEERPGNDSDPDAAGIGLSPQLAQAVGLEVGDGGPSGRVTWRFVPASAVPAGTHSAVGVLPSPY